MANRAASTTTTEAPVTDHDQILAAVVAALGKSSSKVADYNSENDCPFEEEVTPKPSKNHHHHHLFSCFSNSAVKTVKASAQSNKFSNWPRSPSHIMSRLLLSPNMSPDRILTKSGASSPGGDQSPVATRFRSCNRSHFSGPLLGMNNKKKNKSKLKEDPSMRTFQNEREEPTSPKVTCMGTVKAPKKISKPGICSNNKPPPDPKWKSLQQQQQHGPHSGFLDLSRFGEKSGELRVRSGELKQFPRPMQQQQQQPALKLDQARKKSNSMRMLMNQEAEFDAAVASGGNCSDQSLKIVACRAASLKKAEEICLWKRRCTTEPMKLQLVGRI